MTGGQSTKKFERPVASLAACDGHLHACGRQVGREPDVRRTPSGGDSVQISGDGARIDGFHPIAGKTFRQYEVDEPRVSTGRRSWPPERQVEAHRPSMVSASRPCCHPARDRQGGLRLQKFQQRVCLAHRSADQSECPVRAHLDDFRSARSCSATAELTPLCHDPPIEHGRCLVRFARPSKHERVRQGLLDPIVEAEATSGSVRVAMLLHALQQLPVLEGREPAERVLDCRWQNSSGITSDTHLAVKRDDRPLVLPVGKEVHRVEDEVDLGARVRAVPTDRFATDMRDEVQRDPPAWNVLGAP